MRTYPHPVGGWAGGFGSWPASPFWWLVPVPRSSPPSKPAIPGGARRRRACTSPSTAATGLERRPPAASAALGVLAAAQFLARGRGTVCQSQAEERQRQDQRQGLRGVRPVQFPVGARSSSTSRPAAARPATAAIARRSPLPGAPDLRQQRRAAARGGLPGGGVAHRHDSGRRAGSPATRAGRRRPAERKTITNFGIKLGREPHAGQQAASSTRTATACSTTATAAPTRPRAPGGRPRLPAATATATASPTAWIAARRRPPAPRWTQRAAPRTPTATTSPTGSTAAPTRRPACWSTPRLPQGQRRRPDSRRARPLLRDPARRHGGRPRLPRRRGWRRRARRPRPLPRTPTGRR